MFDLIVEKRSVYGETKIYPICETSKVFAEIAGTKTLTPHTIDCIKRLGLTMRLRQDEFV